MEKVQNGRFGCYGCYTRPQTEPGKREGKSASAPIGAKLDRPLDVRPGRTNRSDLETTPWRRASAVTSHHANGDCRRELNVLGVSPVPRRRRSRLPQITREVHARAWCTRQCTRGR